MGFLKQACAAEEGMKIYESNWDYDSIQKVWVVMVNPNVESSGN